MQRLITPIVILLTLLILLPISASDAAQPLDWEVVYYDSGSNQVVTLNSNGIWQRTVLPIRPTFGDDRLSMVMSPDRQKIAVFESMTSAYIVDLGAGTCCLPLPNPIGTPLDAWLGGAFSPDSTQFAVGYVALTPDFFQGGVMVMDANTGNLVITLPDSQLGAMTGLVEGWTPGGIEIVGTCWACEGTISGLYSLWQPQQNRFLDGMGDYFDFIYGATYLPTTSEVISAYYDDRFPSNPIGMFADANTIAYFPNRESILNDTPQIIYQDSDILDLPHPEWVVNGQAVLVALRESSNAFLLFRDSRILPVTVPLGEEFVAGTPDGWVNYDPLARTFFYYRYDITTNRVNTTTLANASTDRVIVLQTPELGRGLSTVGFATDITTPSTPSTPPAVACPGFMPSRLTIGQPARITPGPPNNFRDGPTLSANRIGQIPGSAPVSILAGPVCADAMAWWQVNYNGQIGWTSEGTGNDYWMEPFN